jgi:DNA topoisomerase-3
LRLFIAEKPSLARAIADALPGPATRARDHIRCGPSDVVAWCAGHILETAPPEAYGEAYKAWRLDVLPIVPREWRLEPKAPELLSAIARLLKHADRVVHAGDPDREGQLLVDEVLSFLGYRGPVERLLISDLSPPAVRQKLGALEPNAKYRPLSDSALARQRADWLYGINMTRLYTLLGRQTGYDGVLSVGRVQTPLLGLIVRRDRAIERFKPSPYFTVTATLQTESGAQFRATWLPGPEHEAHLDDEKRLLRRQIAEAVIRSTQGAGATVASRADKPCTEPAPLPYALADLQMDAGKRLGLSAQEVLDAAQSLYETHQLLTYPRSDCPYLPEAHHAQAPAVLAAAARQVPALATLVGRADRSRRSKAWADGKVTAHHAIIPTPAAGPVRALTAHEAAVYELVSRRYLAQFFPAHEAVQTELAIHFAGATFRATGRRVVAPGWKAVLSNGAAESDDEPKAPEGDNPSLPDVQMGDRLLAVSVSVADKKTQPPKPFTDASLIDAMCNVAKFVSDAATKKILSDADGIGTPATRAAIIETLFERGYVERVKKTVVSTPTGRALVDALPAVATTPDMTAVWEAAMRAIVERRQSLDLFLTRVEAQLRQLVEQGKARGAIAVAAPPAPAPRAVDARRAPSRGSTRRSRSPSPAPKTPAGR